MGDAVMRKSMLGTSRPGLVAVATATLLAWGCASGAPKAATPAPTATTAQATQANPVAAAPRTAEIQHLDVYDESPGARIEIRSDLPLVWTSYRDAEGNLVIDLPNTEATADLSDRTFDDGLVASVRVSSAGVPSRPLTRLVVATRQSSEHRLEASGSDLTLQLTPSGQPFTSAATAEQTMPLAAPSAVETAPSAQAEVEPAPAQVAEEPLEPVSYGTPDNPVVAPQPEGAHASSLEGVRRVGEATVRIAGDGEFAYSTFRLENPERFVIDLEGVVNRSDRGSLTIAEGPVNRVRVSQFKAQPDPVARVVFDLTKPAVPAIERTERGLIVRFGDAAVVAAAESVPAASTAAPRTETVAALPVAVPAETTSAPASAPLPEAPAAEAASDVAAFAAPAAAPSPARVADFEAQDVQPIAEAAAQPPSPESPRLTPALVAGQTVVSGKKEYTGEPISMSLKDADVKEVLRTFARLSGLNVVIQPGVRGTVTVELEKVPWDQALDQILKINGLGYEIEGNIMRIAPVSVLEQEAKRAQALAAAQSLSLPLQTVVKRLSYSTAGEIAGLLRRGGGIMSNRGSVIVDARTNTLIIKELPTYIDTVLAVIETLDTPEPQVMIEARIVETTKQFSRSLGISWGFNGVSDQQHGNTTGLQFPYHGTADGGVGLLTGGANGFINLSLGNVLDTFTLNARLQAAESEGLVNILSAPKVSTMNNNAASIQSGVQLPIQTTANNTTTVQFVNATLKLQVTPHVTAEGTVMLDISVQKREPLFSFQVAGAPSAPIATKEAKTRVIVRDGATTVIGGIYKVTTDQGQDRVPGLANVPLLGHLFKNRRSRNDNDELLIFISPRVIKL